MSSILQRRFMTDRAYRTGLSVFISRCTSAVQPCFSFPKIVTRDRARLEAEGLSMLSFASGVSNVAVTAFLLGRFPEYFWMFHGIKSLFLLVYQVMRRSAGALQNHSLNCAYLGGPLGPREKGVVHV